ncbi:aldehyde ferredoxin oxidoreductase family protein [Desulfofundulus sp. TPOSR]|uniref:aldehyde ferredoxin oxidoreductase family protein n=1 Tax=Desulfofundulus sp. TPOSR TaxID=2714340 RepID=UPI001A9B5F3B|nr:aldehyde ferredoxin oxidoreductase family protein [Desulfofundulus sp. TPOSR]
MNHLAGDLVHVNLTTGEIKRRPWPEDVIKSYLGGRGLADYILLKYLSRSVEPLDPGNILVFSPGFLSGTRMITTGRLHISARSPLTGFLGSSNGGGHFAAELKACGISALIVTGRAEKPSFINIRGEEVTIEDATPVWGLKTHEARRKLKELAGDNQARVILIGPAGENLSALGCVVTDVGHAAGRTGMGAVMGSKNLKAVVARKTASFNREVPEKAVRAVKEYIEKLKSLPCWEEWTTDGSSTSVSWTDRLGACGVKNFRQVTFEGIETACGSAYRDLLLKHHSCYNCPIHCRAFVRIDRGRHAGFIGDRGEYEPLSMWGPRCGNPDGLESIYLCNLCDEYGIDSMETGSVVAFAIDLFERGILTKEDTEGLELTWGNALAMEEMVHRMANRRTWLGNVLTQGIKRAAEIIGRGAEKYAYHVKGLSLPIMDPRGFKGSGLGYAVASRGADFCHVYAKPEYAYTPEQALAAYGTEKVADRLSEEGKPLLVKQCLCANAVIDSLGICKIPEFAMLLDFDLAEAAKVLSAFAGEEFTGEQLLKIGERIINAERLFNFRFGATGSDDTLPGKFLTEPVPEGPCKGSVVHLEPMLKEFYSLMGWNENGSVGEAKKSELGLEGLTGEDDLARI